MATQIINIGRRLENNTEHMIIFRNLPTGDPLPILMVGICLVLAPDVSLFLYSCKQGFSFGSRLW